MHIRLKGFLIKVFALSTILVLGLNIGDNLINATSINKTKTQDTNTNQSQYKSTNNSNLGLIGVAISTNIGTKHMLRQQLPVSIYKEVMSIQQIISKSNVAQEELIAKNMQSIQEYRNILKTDVLQLLSSSYDKRDMLNAFIEQLEFRFKQGTISANNLIKQRDTLANSMSNSNTQVEALKQKISNDFIANDAKASVINIEEYTKLKEQYYYARAYSVYINQFVAQYEFLNEYNKRLLDVLINNKDAIVKNAFVVIPDTSDVDTLRQFNLIFDEAEVK